MRAVTQGPAAERAYHLLDAWMQADASVVDALKRRQLRRNLIELREQLTSSQWYQRAPRRLVGAHYFVRLVDYLLERLPGMSPRQMARYHRQLLSARQLVVRAIGYITRLHEQIDRLMVEHNVAAGSDVLQFIRLRLIRRFDHVLSAALEPATAAKRFARAREAFDNQVVEYQDYKVEQFESQWSTLERGHLGAAITIANTSGLRAQVNESYTRFSEHQQDLEPRVQRLFERHESGEHIDAAKIATIQRDLIVLAVELNAFRALAALHQTLEQLETLEEAFWGDFDELQAALLSFAWRLCEALEADEIAPSAELLTGSELPRLQDDVRFAVEQKERISRLVDLGILGLSLVGGGLLGMAVGGGARLLLMGRTAMTATGVAQVSRGLGFAANVAGFTVSHEALSSAAFGHEFRTEELPEQFALNATMFLALGYLSKASGRMFPSQGGSLRRVLSFGARHGVNLGGFAGLSLAVQGTMTGQLPDDWRVFVEDTVAAYVLVNVIGARLTRLRQRIEDEALRTRLTELGEMEAELRTALGRMTDPSRSTVQRRLAKDEAIEVRQRLLERAAETGELATALHRQGHLSRDVAQRIQEASAVIRQRLEALELSSESPTLIDLAALPGIEPAGPDIYTFPTGLGRAEGLQRALDFYRRRGGSAASDGSARYTILPMKCTKHSGLNRNFSDRPGSCCASTVTSVAEGFDTVSQTGG